MFVPDVTNDLECMELGFKESDERGEKRCWCSTEYAAEPSSVGILTSPDGI